MTSRVRFSVSFTGYRERVGPTGKYLMMMKTIVMLSNGVVTKTGVLVYHGDVTIMGQNVKASALCKNVSNFQFLMHKATFPLRKKTYRDKNLPRMRGNKNFEDF